MANVKKPVSKLLSLLLMVPTVWTFASNLIFLVRAEAGQAKKTLSYMVILLVALGCLIATSWVCLLAVLYIYLLSIHLSLLAALSIIMGINLLLMAALIFVLLQQKQQLTFPLIRSQFIRK